MHYVLLPPCKEVIDDDYAVAPPNQPVHKVASDEPGTAGDDDSKTLPLQPKRDLPTRAHEPKTATVLVSDTVSESGGFRWEIHVGDRVVVVAKLRRGGREEGEDEGSDDDAHKDEDEALFAKHVSDWASYREPWFRGFWGIHIGLRLGFMASENQLRSHLPSLVSLSGFLRRMKKNRSPPVCNLNDGFLISSLVIFVEKME